MAETSVTLRILDPIDSIAISEPAVKVRNADKSYRVANTSKYFKVLNNLNVTVPKGCIYGLLGPSGCGKTSLLRCILGRLKMDKGTVLVFGHVPGTVASGIPGPLVGYMAQENTLYPTMTIAEILRYFGTIHDLSEDDIKERTKYFVDLLRLPPKDTLIGKLSGGEMRRVSFATSLLHDPKLLVLDEPTVGVDPITKRGMWDHLFNLAKHNGTSIILTTHYIEEARQADLVGMIHRGVMVAEDSTRTLLRRYNAATLEDVFLQLCCAHYPEMEKKVDDNSSEEKRASGDIEIWVKGNEKNGCSNGTLNDETNKRHSLDTNLNGSYKELDEPSEKEPFLRSLANECRVSWNRLKAVIVRNVINLYRFPGIILCLLLLPFSQVFLFTQTMGTPIGGINLGVINEDLGDLGMQYLSCLDPNTIIQKFYENLSDGSRGARDGETYGYLHIKPNFSQEVLERFTNVGLVDKEIIMGSTITVHMDNTNFQITRFAEYHLKATFLKFLSGSLLSAGFNPALADYPINISSETMTSLTKPASVYIITGELTISAYFSGIPITVLGIFLERYLGHLEINSIAGITSAEMVLGLVLIQFVFLILQNVGIILAALPVTYTSKGSIFLMYCLTYAIGMNGTLMGIFLSLLCDNNITLFSAAVLYLFIAAAFTGMFWPIEAYPVIIQYICWAFPLSYPMRALDFIIHRGWDLYRLEVMYGFASSIIWLVLHLILSLILLHIKK